MELNKTDRDLLWKALKSKYLQDCRKSGETAVSQVSESFFGYANYDPAKEKRAPTIKRFMMEQNILTPEAAKIFNTQYLYKKFILESPPVKMKSLAIAYCLNYINYPGDFKNFRSAYQRQLQEDLSYYRGFYYSRTTGRVLEFSLCWDLQHGHPYDVQQWRLHKRQEEDEDQLYSGIALRKRSFLYLQLENELQLRHLYLVFYTGAGDFKNLPYLFGTFNGVSNNDEPMAGECILIKSTREKILPFNARERLSSLVRSEWLEGKQAEYYLMLRRNHFKSLSRIPVDQESFAKTCGYTTDLHELAGIYQIINYTRKGHLIVSWLQIKENMEGCLRTRFDGKTKEREVLQRCEFQIEHYQGNSYLHVFGYLDQHLHNYAIYDLNYPSKQKEQSSVLLGAFCSCSTNGCELAGQYMMAMKVGQDGDISTEQNYTSRRIKKEELQKNIQEDQLLSRMRKQLDEVLNI